MPLRDKLMVINLLLGGIAVFLCQTMLAPAFPSIMRDFGIEATDVQWLASAYTLAMAVVVPANAYLLARFSARSLYFWCMIGFAVGCIVTYIAPVFPAILAGRILQGFMAGVMMPTVITSVFTMFPEERRGMATGIISLSISVAPAVGPALSGVLIDFFGWRSLFAFLTIYVLVAGIASRFTIFDRVHYESTSLDIPSAILMIIGMSTLLYGTSSLASSGNLAVSIVSIAVGIVFTALFVVRQGKLEYPFLKVSVMRIIPFTAAGTIMALTNAALICTESVFPIYIQDVLGESAFVSGIAIFPAVLIGLPFALVSGRLFDKYGLRGVALTGAALLLVGAVPLLFYTPTTSVILLAVLFVLMQIGCQLLFAPSQAWGLGSLEPQEVPHGSSLFSTFEQIGSSFGVAIVMGLISLPNAIGMDTGGSVFPGVHLGFIGCFVMVAMIAVLVVIFAHDKRN